MVLKVVVVPIFIYLQGQDFVVIILYSLEDYVDWKILSNQFSKTFVIIIKKKFFKEFTESFPYQNLYYLYFYVMIYDDENETKTEVKEIMVLKNETKILLSDINQMKNDLQGIEIKSITGILVINQSFTEFSFSILCRSIEYYKVEHKFSIVIFSSFSRKIGTNIKIN